MKNNTFISLQNKDFCLSEVLPGMHLRPDFADIVRNGETLGMILLGGSRNEGTVVIHITFLLKGKHFQRLKKNEATLKYFKRPEHQCCQHRPTLSLISETFGAVVQVNLRMLSTSASLKRLSKNSGNTHSKQLLLKTQAPLHDIGTHQCCMAAAW